MSPDANTHGFQGHQIGQTPNFGPESSSSIDAVNNPGLTGGIVGYSADANSPVGGGWGIGGLSTNQALGQQTGINLGYGVPGFDAFSGLNVGPLSYGNVDTGDISGYAAPAGPPGTGVATGDFGGLGPGLSGFGPSGPTGVSPSGGFGIGDGGGGGGGEGGGK